MVVGEVSHELTVLHAGLACEGGGQTRVGKGRHSWSGWGGWWGRLGVRLRGVHGMRRGKGRGKWGQFFFGGVVSRFFFLSFSGQAFLNLNFYLTGTQCTQSTALHFECCLHACARGLQQGDSAGGHGRHKGVCVIMEDERGWLGG